MSAANCSEAEQENNFTSGIGTPELEAGDGSVWLESKNAGTFRKGKKLCQVKDKKQYLIWLEIKTYVHLQIKYA